MLQVLLVPREQLVQQARPERLVQVVQLALKVHKVFKATLEPQVLLAPLVLLVQLVQRLPFLVLLDLQVLLVLLVLLVQQV